MFDAKLKSYCDSSAAKELIGKEVEVVYINTCRGGVYHYCLNPSNNCSFDTPTIDPFLPTSNPSKKREWEVEFRSNDSVIVNKKLVTIDNIEYTPEQLKEHFGKCGAALKKLNEINKK